MYISHAFSSNPVGNRDAVARIARGLVYAGHLPLAPQLLFPQFLDETTERDLALQLCLRLVALADEVRVYGDVTAGMRLEIDEAHGLGIPVVPGQLP